MQPPRYQALRAVRRQRLERTVSISVVLVCVPWGAVHSANTQTSFSYPSSISADSNGPLDLVAELNYDNGRTNAPIAVVMHGYSAANGGLANVRANAQRLRDAGFFAISVAMRGRDGSDGVRDSGGLEIYDIYDAVEAVKTGFPSLVNGSNVHITGYSGGGGNAMSTLTKFPDYFRVGSAFFGMSDYGFDQINGWYQNGASASHQSQLRTDVGNPTIDNALVNDRYLARASNKASHNNPYSEIHFFVNDNETTCPPINDASYRDNAIAKATVANEFSNIRVHIGNAAAPTYRDFDGDMVDDPSELQSWPHGFPTANQQAAAEGWYLSRLLNGSIPEPVLNNSDELFVAGFVKTKKFELRLGDGQNAAGTLDYNLSATRKQFDLEIETSNAAITGSLWVSTADLAGKTIDVLLNGNFTESFTGGGTFHFDGIGDGDTLLLSVHLPGDYNRDTVVDLADYQVWRDSFGVVGAAAADGNGDEIVDAADYLIWRRHATAPPGQSAVAVPETASGTVFIMTVLAISAGRTALRRGGWRQGAHKARPRISINRLK